MKKAFRTKKSLLAISISLALSTQAFSNENTELDNNELIDKWCAAFPKICSFGGVEEKGPITTNGNGGGTEPPDPKKTN
ncbi:hypothetical protein [Glaciecola sp. KUL10]|uniref:hypothetical protein n=1 Tax=Glaciecola sp. (strain KUL10) TaxID=2161813 RepID=UPI000D782223|nr:hypothetical protein [Glaciecola sp. KUL10]GBL02951.1 hypothetical protein KUL10_02240 [Glaciecola sp. KUL10]